MNIVDLINKKRLGLILSDKEIEYIIKEFMSGNIKDYQMSSLLMAIAIRGMTDNEIFSLTKYMLESGERLDLSHLEPVVDKHSTGGVGDKTTMIIAPIVASLGVNVAKMSGKGLGHTGGTIDKLSSIPGFKVDLTTEEFYKQVREIGLAIVSQTNNLVPADKKIYALRDVTGTVSSVGLIASSIMSKKIASGAKKLVIDVKVGKGALINDIEEAEKLAKLMIKIGKKNNIQVICLLTNMNIPLGSNIGNTLEVIEAIDILQNNKNNELKELCIELSSHMVSLGLNINYKQAKEKVIEVIENGQAYNKFLQFIKYQGGNINKLKLENKIYEFKSPKAGYLNNIDALELGKLSMELGAGRKNIDDKIDYASGIVLNKNIGDYVKRGEVLMTLYTTSNIKASIMNIPIFSINKQKQEKQELIYKIIK